MRKMTRFTVTVAAFAIAGGVALADATVEQKTQAHFGGAIGGIINVFGGKATHEGLTSTTVIKGDRKLTRSGDSGEIIDLGAEKIYRVDFARKTYKVVTFDELRKQFEEQKSRSEKSDEKSAEKNKGPEYEVDFDIRDTGAKETINGYNTHQVVATATVHEKGKTLAQSGGSVLTADMWMGPHVAAMREISDFDQRYYAKLYGPLFGAAEMQQMAVLMATNPTFAKAMKAFSQKRSSMEGTAIRTNLSFETVAGKDQPADEDSGSASPLGGLMRRMQQRRQEKNGEDPARSRLFDSTVELLKATGAANGSDVTVPAGFTQR